MDIESYERQKEAMLLLKVIAQGEEEIKGGKIVGQDKFFSRLDRNLGLK